MAINSTDFTAEQLYKQKQIENAKAYINPPYDVSSYSQAYGGGVYNPVGNLTSYGNYAGSGLTNPERFEEMRKLGIMGFFDNSDIENIKDYIKNNKESIAIDLLFSVPTGAAILKGLQLAKNFRGLALKPLAEAVEAGTTPIKSMLENSKMVNYADKVYEKELALKRASKNFLPPSLIKTADKAEDTTNFILKNPIQYEGRLKNEADKLINAIEAQVKLKKQNFPNWTYMDELNHMKANFEQIIKSYKQMQDLPGITPEELAKAKQDAEKYQIYLNILEEIMKDMK